MKRNKWEYFLNAMHYCIWLMDIKFDNCVWRIMDRIFIPFEKFIFTKSFQKKLGGRRERTQKKLNSFLYDLENGYHIEWANHWFGYFYSGYPGFVSLALLGVAIRIFENPNGFLMMVLIGIPIGFGYIPAYKAVFSDDRYLQYFKQFEKEDEAWHKKWKRRTIAFCVGSVITTLLGMAAAFAIAIL